MERVAMGRREDEAVARRNAEREIGADMLSKKWCKRGGAEKHELKLRGE